MKVEVRPGSTTTTAGTSEFHRSLVMPAVARESSRNPLSPVRMVRSLVGCAILGVVGMCSKTTQAATPDRPWRAQWGHPTHVTVTGQGQAYVMTYKQFFDWVGKGKHPNESGIKVVGTLPANIAAERASGTRPAAQAPQGQPTAAQTRTAPQGQSTAANYAAWAKYQQDLQRYHYEMAQYQAKVAAWHQAQAQAQTTAYRALYQQQPLGPVQEGGFKAAVKGLGQSLWNGVQSIGGDIKQGVKNAQYTPTQLAAAQPQAPRVVTPQRAAPLPQQPFAKKSSPAPAPQKASQRSVTPKPSVTTAKPAASAPKPAPQPKATSGKSAGPSPSAKPMPEPALPVFDLSASTKSLSLLLLPKLAEGTPVDPSKLTE